MLEISKMLTISMAHVSKETADLIKDECNTWCRPEFPACFVKGEYGYFVHVPEDWLTEDEEGVPICAYEVPDDLFYCMDLAYENRCNWLCLDYNGMIVEDLQVFDW